MSQFPRIKENRSMKVVITPKTTASYDFTNYQIETLLYTIEGYMQGNDDEKLVNELSDLFQILHDGLLTIDS
tara:strand:+ start:1229 stop:1444 length:216 start_codon:yes stop_codon:yes gene_type:complete